MHQTLLTTKLYFPPVRSSLVSRPRLVERLQTGLPGTLTLISAPAGYGKTTLMSEWRAGVGCDYSIAWLSLDIDDNDSTSFLTYIIAALATLKPGFGETALGLLQSSQPLPSRVILTSLINELGEFDKTFFLVLDDYHVITHPSIHEAVTYLLDHLPSQMHLVILTRADPPLPLSRLRARNQLAEIRAADLRFTVEEAAAFLNQIMGLSLSAEQVGALEQRTEGWVTGLQLAALSMQSRDDLQSFVLAFTGSHHYIVDYLADEVLSSQPEPVREFLLRTSILDRLTAPLCDALTDRTDGQTTLEKLEQTNLFLIPLDDEQHWYRYHHLFREVLRKRLEQIYPDAIPELHRKAAAWCEQNHLIESAVEHTIIVKDYDQVVRLLRQHYFQQMLLSKIPQIWRWFEGFPDEVIRGNPWLCAMYAWLLWNRGNRDAAEFYLNYAQQALGYLASTDQLPKDDPEYDALPAQILGFQGAISASKGESERTIELVSQALAMAPETAYTLRSTMYLNLYLVHRDQGEIEKAIDACTQAIPLAKMGSEKGSLLDALYYLGLMHTIQGQLDRAAQVYREGLQYIENERQFDYPGCSLFFIYLAGIYYEWNDLDEAERLANRALELSEPAYWWVMIYGRAFLARLQRTRGNWPVALKLLEEAETILQQLKGAYFENQLRAFLARSHAEFGEANKAVRWTRSLNLDLGDRFNYPKYVLAFQLAYTLSALGREDELLTLLSKIEPVSAAQGCFGWQIQALVLETTAWQKKANRSRALTCLEKALFLAEQEGYVRVFLDEGEPMAILLQHAATKGVHPAYVRRLLSAAFSADKRTTLTQPLIEPLSGRELEVLRLVAEGKSNQQIANALVIATGTVKKHLNNIFGKLGVQSRTHCVARARELRLL
jgi:LuxR family maltose regulon positive regulatory protein